MKNFLTATGNEWNGIPENERRAYMKSLVDVVNVIPIVPGILPKQTDSDKLVDETNKFYQTSDPAKLNKLVVETMGQIIREDKVGKK